MPGNPSTSEDEADVGISVDITDVRCAVTNAACPSGQGSDYTGRLLATSTVRITDKFNGPSQEKDGTVVDTQLEIPLGCTTTAGTGIGAHCAVNTTMDALLPGAVVEGGRAVWQTGAVRGRGRRAERHRLRRAAAPPLAETATKRYSCAKESSFRRVRGTHQLLGEH